MLTDYAMAAVGGGLGVSLARRGLRQGQAPRWLWGGAFVAVALAAVLGGTSHGFGPHLGEGSKGALWLATYSLVGLANLLILAGAVRAATRGVLRQGLLALLVLRFTAYLALFGVARDFRYVLYDYALTLACLLVLGLYGRARSDPSAPWILAGVLASALGAVAQGGGLALHRHFNHNDLFHVLQTLGLYLYYRGGGVLPDR